MWSDCEFHTLDLVSYIALNGEGRAFVNIEVYDRSNLGDHDCKEACMRLADIESLQRGELIMEIRCHLVKDITSVGAACIKPT